MTFKPEKPLAEKVMEFRKVCGKEARCRGCNEQIWWFATKTGKPAPFNHDLVSHFATCPKAEDFRKPKPDPQAELL